MKSSMTVSIHRLLLCAGLATAIPGLSMEVASAQPKKAAPKAPKANPKQLLSQAQKAFDAGDYAKARELTSQGLAAAPKDKGLLALHGRVLIKLYDYDGALVAYRAYAAVEKARGPLRDAKDLIANLEKVSTTILEVTVSNGPASVHLESASQAELCRAEPVCTKPVFPNAKGHTVYVVRPGFETWSEQVKVVPGETAKVAVTLVELPSLIAVRATPPDARITIGNAPYTEGQALPPGRHEVVARLVGFSEVRRTVEARGGEPIVLEFALPPLVAVRVEPASAELLLDGKPVVAKDGKLEVPPGAHVIVVRARGYRERQLDIPAVRSAGFALDVALDRGEVPGPVEAPRPSGGMTAQRKIAIAVGGVAVLAAAGGVLLGVQAGNLEDEAMTVDEELDAESRRLQSHLAYGTAGLAAAVALGLWIDGAPHRNVTVAAGAGHAPGLTVRLKF